MKIQIQPKFFEGYDSWTPKCQGVILVQKEEHIDIVWQVLCEQDDYWESYKNLIKIVPNMINEIADLERLCEYVGKTDIYNAKEVRDKLKSQNVEFLIFQYHEESRYYIS